MVKLPDWTDLGAAPAVSGARPVASYDPSPLARGAQALGQGIATLGKGIESVGFDKDRYEYHQAHADLVTQSIGQYDQLVSDTDYATMPKRYGEQYEKNRQEAAQRITNPAMRERFLLDTQDAAAQFNSNIYKHAFKLSGDARTVYRSNYADTIINKAQELPSEVERRNALDAYNGLVDGDAKQGHMTPEQGATEKKNFAERYAIAAFLAHSQRDPDAALAAIEHPAEGSIYSIIPEDARQKLIQRARSDNAGEQESVRRAVNDDVSSILKTGQGTPTISEERIMRAFGPRGSKAVLDWKQARDDALSVFSGTHDMPDLNEDAIRQRIQQYQEKADKGGEGIERRQQVSDEVRKQGERVLKQRYEDPAAAVADNPAVKAASSGYAGLDPSSFLPVAKARMEAQARLGISEEVRSPLTKAEALKLTTPLARMLPGDERQTLTDLATQFQQMFGEDADQAFTFALRARKVDNQTAQTAARVMRKLGLGQPITPDEARDADHANEVTAAQQAVTTTAPYQTPPRERLANPGRVMARAESGATSTATTAAQPQQPIASTPAKDKDQARMPPAEDIIALRRNPSLGARFDQKYGEGAAKKILEQYPVGIPNRQQNLIAP